MLKNFKKQCCDKRKSKKGFSLIEMVVVIAIMAVLALIMVPNLTAYIQKGDDAQMKANLKNVHTAVQLVIQSNPKISAKDLNSDASINNRLGTDGVETLKAEVAKYANVPTSQISFMDATIEFVENLYVIDQKPFHDGILRVSARTDRVRYSYDGSEYTETAIVPSELN